jgi:SAM-dependent methyltransferase
LEKFCPEICGSLKKHLQVVDVGCGNGRNSEFMKKKGYKKVLSLDMVNDYGQKMILGKDDIPLPNKSTDIILCNYLMMFLNKKERKQLIREIKRIARDDCVIMVELYPAKDSETKTKEEMLELQQEIFDSLKWHKKRYSQGRFIAVKRG